jgi:hypothetical protein
MNQSLGGSWKYIISLTFLVLLVSLVLSAVSLVFLFQMQDRLENTEAAMDDLKTALDDMSAAVDSLNETANYGSTGSRLVMIWNNSYVVFAPGEIGSTDYLPAHFSYDVSSFHNVYIYYWRVSGSSVSNWNVGFYSDAFQRPYVESLTISSSDVHVLALDVQATYLNVTCRSYSGDVAGYLSLYLYLV